MFERYTEKSRRAIFFARYEASQYGSRYIETEHLLLGILRERRDKTLKVWFLGENEKNIRAQIRNEIERSITRGERISTSVEVPLTMECRKILQLAADSAHKLGHNYIQPEHLLIAILQVEDCLAAQILSVRGLKASQIEKQLEEESRLESARLSELRKRSVTEAHEDAQRVLHLFLDGLKSLAAGALTRFFTKDARFIDASGKRWTREEIEHDGEMLFAVYAKKNAAYVVEEALVDASEIFVATVLWKNAILASQERGWMYRMMVVLQLKKHDWKIVMVQVTPVQASSSFFAGK